MLGGWNFGKVYILVVFRGSVVVSYLDVSPLSIANGFLPMMMILFWILCTYDAMFFTYLYSGVLVLESLEKYPLSASGSVQNS